jgi:hypothetical protein
VVSILLLGVTIVARKTSSICNEPEPASAGFSFWQGAAPRLCDESICRENLPDDE